MGKWPFGFYSFGVRCDGAGWAVEVWREDESKKYLLRWINIDHIVWLGVKEGFMI